MSSSWLKLALKSCDLSQAEKKMTFAKAEQILKRQLTMRRNLLNWCNLLSIRKKLMFYIFGW